MPRFARLSRAVVLLPALLGPPVLAADKELDDQIARFQKAKTVIDAKAVKAFEQTVRAAKADTRIKEAARAEVVEKVTGVKQRFEKYGRWPADPSLGLDDDEWAYNRELGEAFGVLSRVYERRMKDARTKKDEAAVSALLESKAKLAAEAFPSREAFAAGSTWSGLGAGPKGGNVKIDVRITAVKETTFEAVIAVNPQVANHPVYEANGTLDGNELNFTKKKQLEGNGGAAHFVGYLSTGRMFLLYGKGGHVIMEKTGGGKKK